MPTFLQEEVRDAVNKMKKDKAPGKDGITTELLQGGGETVVKGMHTLVTKIQQEEEIPEDWAKSTIVPIYKRKGDPQDCKNYRGISLQSIPGKIFHQNDTEQNEAVCGKSTWRRTSWVQARKKHN